MSSTKECRCGGVTQKGTRCKNTCLPGLLVCRIHRDQQAQVESKMGERVEKKETKRVAMQREREIREEEERAKVKRKRREREREVATHGGVYEPYVRIVRESSLREREKKKVPERIPEGVPPELWLYTAEAARYNPTRWLRHSNLYAFDSPNTTTMMQIARNIFNKGVFESHNGFDRATWKVSLRFPLPFTIDLSSSSLPPSSSSSSRSTGGSGAAAAAAAASAPQIELSLTTTVTRSRPRSKGVGIARFRLEMRAPKEFTTPLRRLFPQSVWFTDTQRLALPRSAPTSFQRLVSFLSDRPDPSRSATAAADAAVSVDEEAKEEKKEDRFSLALEFEMDENQVNVETFTYDLYDAKQWGVLKFVHAVELIPLLWLQHSTGERTLPAWVHRLSPSQVFNPLVDISTTTLSLLPKTKVTSATYAKAEADTPRTSRRRVTAEKKEEATASSAAAAPSFVEGGDVFRYTVVPFLREHVPASRFLVQEQKKHRARCCENYKGWQLCLDPKGAAASATPLHASCKAQCWYALYRALGEAVDLYLRLHLLTSIFFPGQERKEGEEGEEEMNNPFMYRLIGRSLSSNELKLIEETNRIGRSESTDPTIELTTRWNQLYPYGPITYEWRVDVHPQVEFRIGGGRREGGGGGEEREEKDSDLVEDYQARWRLYLNSRPGSGAAEKRYRRFTTLWEAWKTIDRSGNVHGDSDLREEWDDRTLLGYETSIRVDVVTGIFTFYVFLFVDPVFPTQRTIGEAMSVLISADPTPWQSTLPAFIRHFVPCTS